MHNEYATQQIADAEPSKFFPKLKALLIWALLIYGVYWAGPYVHRWWDRMCEIRPHEYAQIKEWDNEWTHDYIQESLSDGVITGWEYTQVYWMLNDGWADSLKDKE